MAVEKKPTRVEGLEFWGKVDKTDPGHTKAVSIGKRNPRRFTSIDAMYQIQCATEQFGPVGSRWWWEVEHSIEGGMFIARVMLHHPLGEHPVIQYGCARFIAEYLDHDAPKKAVTDGLTKCLSYLGFNADVFLGKFDDNKYVAERRAAVAQEKATPATHAQVAHIQELAATVYGNGAADHVTDQLKKRNVRDFATLPENTAVRWITYLEARVGTKDAAPDPLPLNTEKGVAV